jgi:hypothetical protein
VTQQVDLHKANPIVAKVALIGTTNQTLFQGQQECLTMSNAPSTSRKDIRYLHVFIQNDLQQMIAIDLIDKCIRSIVGGDNKFSN